jgi:dihydrofolate synthase/folylpolyglutamate synthase
MLARLLALHPKRIDLSLDRIERLLAALDHPERRLPPVIHVAGTNGKGSTIAFMRAVLEAAGKRVHVYTSPNLVRLNERFRLGQTGGGRLVGDAELGAALAECEANNGTAPITVFEIETAAAFVLFSRNPADVLLLEVGLGGRLDATNVVERPAPASSRGCRSTIASFSAIRLPRSPPRRPAFSSAMCRQSLSVRRARRLR